MKVLITGSSGFVGSRFACHLAQKGLEVIGLDILPGPDSKAQTVLCDLSVDHFLLPNELKQDWDVIVHCATELDFSSNYDEQLEIRNINMTRNAIKIAKQSRSNPLFIFISSASIFLGHKDLWEIPQDCLPEPIDGYGRSKVASENLITESKLRSLIVRCPMIVDEGRSGMLSIPFELAMSGARLWILGTGATRHQMLSLSDLLNFLFLSILKNYTGTVNLGCTNADSLLSIYQAIINAALSDSKIGHLPTKPALLLLRILREFGASPLGPYQFRMLTTDFKFSLRGLEENYDFQPQDTNVSLILRAFSSWSLSRSRAGKGDVILSGNQSDLKWGILVILKLIKL